jgi:ATP-dependent protease HslVU (ClpYQ) ATPase subunit
MTKDKVVEFLRGHKQNIAVHETLINDYSATLKASSVTNQIKTSKVSDLSDLILRINKELEDLEKEIRRVQIWLDYLTIEERFYVENYYIQGVSVTSIITKWCNQGNRYRSEFFWKNRKKAALEKIITLEKRARLR